VNKHLTLIIQKSSWKKAVLFSAIFVIFYVVINFSDIGVAGLLKITGGANILDFAIGYTKLEAYQMLSALGTEGMSFYITKILPMDFVFPISYTLFYIGWIAVLIKNSTLKSQFNYLILVPIFGMVFDWLENIGIIVLINTYPNLSSWAVFLASNAGILKAIFSAGIPVIIIILVIVLFIQKQRK